MATRRQVEANRKNSKISTGPKSIDGKTIASRNATSHGILSTRLFLADEDPESFKLLFEELTATFKPQGIMEMILVEKIAIAIWKQRRIIAAETASITLSRQESHIFKYVNNSLGKYLPYDKVSAEDLEPVDHEIQLWAEAVMEEWQSINGEGEREITTELMKSDTPQCWGILQNWSQSENLSVENYLKKEGRTLTSWFKEQKKAAEQIIAKSELQPKIEELYNAASAELSILPDNPRASIERYQTTIDNQLYRAIKELRQLQHLRLNTIETVSSAETNADIRGKAED